MIMASLQPNILSPQPHHRHHLSTSHLLPPLIAAIVTTFSLLLIFLFFLLWRHLFKPPPPPPTSSLPRRFSYSTLRRATASFSASRRLGQGGFGAVYGGTLTLTPGRKIPVAVKLMDSGSLQGEREFQNEILLANNLVDSDRVVKVIGFASSRKRRRMCLVYELMPNGNLQDCLLHRKCEELIEWSNRFRIAIEVARGLAYLHHHCDPPVIHGDIKPSNILLDDNFCAKIGDFGLARLKLVDNNNDVVVDIEENHGIKGNNNDTGVEDNGSVMETESVTTTVGFEDGSPELAVATSPEMVTAVNSPSVFLDMSSDLHGQFDRVSVENTGKELVELGNGNGNGNGKGKEYVMEWMGKEIDKEKEIRDRINGRAACSSSSVAARTAEEKKGKRTLEWWVSMDDDGKFPKKEKRKPIRQWWKEDYREELTRNKKKKKKKQYRGGTMSDNEENFWPRDDNVITKRKCRSKRSSQSSIDWWLDGLSSDPRMVNLNHPNYDSMSGGISSTPSMRGTMCYIAPECNTNGDNLSEKCDVYSFGVLLLVLIAGRRPLQVTGSPMSEFHKANLVSWARRLARAGKLLDLVDKKIRSLIRDQAQLCIVVALICLQKSPAFRPSMKEVVGMLTGELDPPQLPIEYSSSSNSKYPFKSRKKLW